MKSREIYISLIKKLEILSSVFLVVMLILSLVMKWGLAGIVSGIIIYILISIYTYSIIKKCACPSCGNTEIFIRKKGMIVGVEERCPRCHKRL